jgi:hypothetical protein
MTLIFALAALLFGIGLPETYQREIMRRRAKRRGQGPLKLAPAGSGETLGEMAKVTIFTPLKMLVSEPIVIGISLYLGFNFAIIFSFFILVPVVLSSTYGFSIQRVGLAFFSAIGGSLLSAATSIVIDRVTYASRMRKGHSNMANIEYRLVPAMIGGIAITASLFWIGWTASPKFSAPITIAGTGVYVWGNMSVLVS